MDSRLASYYRGGNDTLMLFLSPNKNKTIPLFVLTSILLHLITFFLVRNAANSMTPKTLPVKVWVALNQNLQIADISKPAVEEVPEKASVQSLYSQKVKKETVNPNSSKQMPKNIKSQQSKQNYTQKILQQKIAQKSIPQNNPQRIPGMPESTTTIQTTPSSSDDYLPFYQYGDRTYVNALANPSVSYYMELYRKFKLAWNPIPSVKRNLDKISGPHLTVRLGVSIDEQGNLVEVRILKSSGIVEYDSEGKRTVKVSAPFSAPPHYLEFQNGLHHMAWNFIVTL